MSQNGLSEEVVVMGTEAFKEARRIEATKFVTSQKVVNQFLQGYLTVGELIEELVVIDSSV